jgi:hypothetical protein
MMESRWKHADVLSISNGWLVRDGCIAVDMESQHWSSVGTKTFRTVGSFAGVLMRRKALPVWQR